jgi:hypothetical protein
MSRTVVGLFVSFALTVSGVGHAQHLHGTAGPSASAAQEGSMAKPKPVMGAKPKLTDAQKIANAMSAAPAAISKGATIMDWPDTPTGQPRQLRAGTNGWVCYPNSPDEFGAASVDDPMCLDKTWQDWGMAWMSKTKPTLNAAGIAYMLQGDKGASNTDPFATGPTADNHWVMSPAHVMVVFPDPSSLDAYPTDPKNGGPWVMWKGTPYAHLMVPVSSMKSATMGTMTR